MKWLTQSRMKVNESQTDLCLFYKQNTAPITVDIKREKSVAKVRIKAKLNNQTVESKNHFNVVNLRAEQS